MRLPIFIFWSHFLAFSVLLLTPMVAARPSLAEATRVCPKRSQPGYPEMVGPDGHVRSVQVESGHPMLASAAQRAVPRRKFAAAADPEIIPIRIGFKL
jgi:hypothetical protein